MIRDRDTLDYIFTLSKQVKKPLVKFYPNGLIIGTDEQFASLNILVHENVNYNIDIPYIFRSTELASLMRAVAEKGVYTYDKYYIIANDAVGTTVINHLELSYSFDEMYNKVMDIQRYKPILYKEEDFQNSANGMFTMKASDGAKMFTIDKGFIMTSFNAIHPANKSDRVDLIIRDNDFYSYTAEFIIYKKKDKYQLHEFLRFRKL